MQNANEPPPTVRAATAADGPAVVEVLMKAFDADPALRWLLKPEPDWNAAHRVFQQSTFYDLMLPHGGCYVARGESGSSAAGAALWSPPGKWQLGFWQQLVLAPTMIRSFGWGRLSRSIKCLNLMQDRHPRYPHWYLLTIGVEPELQGRGIGKALMRPVLERCDRDRIPAYLENSKEANLPVYRGQGFEVVEQIEMPGGGPPLWFMLREPRAV